MHCTYIHIENPPTNSLVWGSLHSPPIIRYNIAGLLHIYHSLIPRLTTCMPQPHSQAHYTYATASFPGSPHVHRSLIPRLATRTPQPHSQAHYTYAAASFPGSLHVCRGLIPRPLEEGYFRVRGSCAHLRGSHEDVAVVHP